MEKLIKFMIIDFEQSRRDVCLYFNREELKSKFKIINSLRSKNVSFLFPVKSFPHDVILKMASEYTDGFDISNENELLLVKEFISDEKQLWCSAPHVLNFAEVNNQNIIIDINNSNDLNTNFDYEKVSLRISTDFLRGESRFGLGIEEAFKLLETHTKINHIHLHLSGVDNSIKDYLRLIELLKSNIEKLNRKLNINLGGGFSPLSDDEFVELVKKCVFEFDGHKLIFEPGRWICNKAGHAVGNILNTNRGFITTSLSPSCHLKWIDPKFKIIFPKTGIITECETNSNITIGGPTCYEDDVISTLETDHKSIKMGNHIIVDSVTGYSVAWNHSFNGISKADVVFIN